MCISKRSLVVAAVAFLATAATGYGADKPNDGKGPEHPGRVGKPGEDKATSSTKDSARDAAGKNGERGVRNAEPK